MQKTTAETSCMLCDGEISNPICSECLAARMQAWLTEKDPFCLSKIEGFKLEGKVKCIFCGNGIALCPKCFSKDVYKQIETMNQVLAKEFVARFDFELRKEVLA